MTAPRAGASRRGGAAAAVSFAFVALLSFGALLAALVSQHAFGMEPCAWCVLQRLVFVAVGVLALLGLVWRGGAGARVAGGLAFVVALGGLAASMWQYFVAEKSASCNLTLADRLVGATGLDRLAPDVFEARASCADAAVKLLGIPYALWAAIAFAACAVALLRVRRA
jgi:disulfide bond formation protein DsbB